MSSLRNNPVHRLTDPDFRTAEVALRRAAAKAQLRAREAGLEPVIRRSGEQVATVGNETITKQHDERDNTPRS